METDRRTLLKGAAMAAATALVSPHSLSLPVLGAEYLAEDLPDDIPG